MIKGFEDDLKPNFVSEKKLFIKIWTSPREVFKFINTYKYEKHVTVLLVLGGVSRAFDRASLKNMGDDFSILGVIAYCVILGALFGWISYYIYSALVSWTGKWLKGKGDSNSLLRVFAYGLIPAIISLLFLIPQIVIYENEIFKSDGDIFSKGIIANIIVYSAMFLELVLGIWSFVLCIIGVSEVQKFSIGKSILNLILPVLVIMIPILILALIVSGFN
jgi:hypothetical protein